MKIQFILVIVFITLLSCNTQVASKNVLEISFSENKIDSIVSNLIIEKKILGASIGIAYKDSIIYSKGFGFKDSIKNTVVNKNVIFPIASVSKFITTIGVLRLQEEGRLSIDNSITEYIPELSDNFSEIKIKNLLNHTSGLARLTLYADSIHQNENLNIRNGKILNHLTNDKFVSAPNETWKYNNTPGYSLISILIERTSGLTFSNFLRNYISEPLELKNTGLCSDNPFNSNYNLTYFVENSLAEYLDNSKIYEQLQGQGGICSTSEDLLKIVSALKNGKLISKSNFELMQQKTELLNNSQIPYGLGTRLGYSGDHFKIGHTGGGFTNFSALFYYPSEDLTIVVLSNCEPSIAPQIAESIAHELFGLEIPKREKLNSNLYEGKYKWGSDYIDYKIDEFEVLWEVIDYGSELDSLDYYFIGNNRFYNEKYGVEVEFQIKNNIAISANTFTFGMFSDSEIAERIEE